MADVVLPPLSDWNVQVGAVASVHGLEGEVRIRSLSEAPDRFAVGSRLCAIRQHGQRESLTICRSRPHKGSALVAFEGITTREAAEALRGASLTIALCMRRELPPGRYYHGDLVGMSVVTVAGRELGTVTEILETPANDVFVTDRALIPAVRDVVHEIDIEARRMLVADLPGLETQTAETA